MAIINISFFGGMAYYTFVNRTYIFEIDDNFITNFNIFDNGFEYRVIQFMYFSFTTLSTVGFGDYSP